MLRAKTGPIGEEGRVRRIALLIALACMGMLAAAPAVRAACCTLVKVDPETPAALVRVCKPTESGACAVLLFSGTLADGERHEVCTASPTIIYEEWDELLGGFGAPVEARCESRDVEI